ncbi:MAG TPA: starch-binding protein, partial [Ruminiclostridium sp.]|nr:starch-binding protein [Ruminiclostridium sp.]
ITSSQAKLCSDGTWQDDLINTTRTVTSGMASLVLPSGWNNPYIYVYDDSGATIKEAAKWPGVPMTKSAVDGIYYYTLPSGWENAKIVFSDNGASQMPAARQPGFLMANNEAKIYKDGTWQDDAINTTRTVTAGMASFVLPSGWGTPYIYVYDDSGASVKTNAAWPGVPMTKSAVDGIYYYTLPSDWSNAKVIFSNNGASQIPGANQPGFTIASSEAKIYKYGTWQDDTINSGN